MQSAPRQLLRLAALFVALVAVSQARVATAPAAPVAIRDAVADAQALAQTHVGATVMRIAGTSMLPYFGEGALIVVTPINEAKLRAGMLVVYRNRFGETSPIVWWPGRTRAGRSRDTTTPSRTARS